MSRVVFKVGRCGFFVGLDVGLEVEEVLDEVDEGVFDEGMDLDWVSVGGAR
jgi:hypothetical protein